MDDRSAKRCAATTTMASLPDDPLAEIISHVPFKSLCSFKCVSKASRDLITNPLHRNKLPQTLEGFYMFDRSWSGICNTDDSEDEDQDEEQRGGPRQVNNGHFIDVLRWSVRPANACFPFLTELPGIERIRLLHHCNGLLLFEYVLEELEDRSARYIVSNPATEQWTSVPSSGREWSSIFGSRTVTSLVFDPAASSHFDLVQITDEAVIPVHVYSSESGVWKPIADGWNMPDEPDMPSFLTTAYVDGMLYVVMFVGDEAADATQIVVMGVEGNVKKTIPAPYPVDHDDFWRLSDYVGRSQGRLHYIYHAELDNDIPLDKQNNELFVWVLEDDETGQWILKDTVSFFHLFGKMNTHHFDVVGVHPHHSLVFLVQHWDKKLISYDMDSKQVSHLCTLRHVNGSITPYVPYFSKLSALENSHRDFIGTCSQIGSSKYGVAGSLGKNLVELGVAF